MPASTTVRRPAVQHRSRPPQPPPVRSLRAVLDLGALPTAPGCARAWTRVILREWQLAGLSDAAELIVSELATNALLASRREGAASFRLILTRHRGELAILVRDFCRSVPRPQDAGEEDETGRGLLLVQAMSGRSGWYPPDDGIPGKAVWAVLEAAPAASGDVAARFTPLAHAWPERARHLASGHAGPRTPRTHAASERSTRDVRQPYR
jgi:anti-sigma regulatory factor (Ser/Thr protein kinase)